VANGGFLFAMCSATDTFDIALAAERVDIVGPEYDHDGFDLAADSKLDFSRTLAFQDFSLEMNPLVYEFSNIDTTPKASLRGQRNDYFTLFDFSPSRIRFPRCSCRTTWRTCPGSWGRRRGSRSPS
jgi:hypothetical protein